MGGRTFRAEAGVWKDLEGSGCCVVGMRRSLTCRGLGQGRLAGWQAGTSWTEFGMPRSGVWASFWGVFFAGVGGGERQVGICVMLRWGTSLDGRLGCQAEPTPGTPLRRAQASRGQGLWVSADLFGQRTGSLDEAPVWVVRQGKASVGCACIPAGFLGRQETPSLTWGPRQGQVSPQCLGLWVVGVWSSAERPRAGEKWGWLVGEEMASYRRRMGWGAGRKVS